MDFLTEFVIVGAIIAAVVVGFGIWLVVLLFREGSGEGTTDPRTQRMASTDVAFGLACFAYLLMLLPLCASGPPDPGHFDPNTHVIEEAIDELFNAVEIFFMLLLWAALAIVLFRRGVSGGMRIVAGLLFPLSGAAAIVAGVLRWRYGGWTIVVPLSLPPLIALYAMWMRQPALHAALPAEIVNPVAWSAILVLTIALIPLGAIDERTYPARQAERARQEQQDEKERVSPEVEAAVARASQARARFEALNADSSLADVLDDLNFPDEYEGVREAHHAEALAKARQVKTRQADLVTLLKGGMIEKLEDLQNLDIKAEPAVCAAYGDALRQETTNGKWESILRQQPNISWLVGQGCNLDPALAAVEAWLAAFCKRYQCSASVPDDRRVLEFTRYVTALRQPH